MSSPLSSPYSVLLGARLVAIRAQKDFLETFRGWDYAKDTASITPLKWPGNALKKVRSGLLFSCDFYNLSSNRFDYIWYISIFYDLTSSSVNF